MILSSDRVRALMLSEDPEKRIVITPVLDWGRQIKPGTCSIDLRLGQKFSVPRRTKLDRLDHLDEQHKTDIELYKDEYLVVLGDYFVLHPRQFILGETLEWIRLPRNLAAYVIGRSSWGRDGLIIATATGVHSSYCGVLTLEITNVGEIPIRLYPGLAIAQLFIHSVDYVEDVHPAASSFAGSTGPSSGDAAGEDKRIIKRLAQLRRLRRAWK